MVIWSRQSGFHLVDYTTVNNSGDLEILSGLSSCLLAQKDKKLKAAGVNNQVNSTGDRHQVCGLCCKEKVTSR